VSRDVGGWAVLIGSFWVRVEKEKSDVRLAKEEKIGLDIALIAAHTVL